MKKETTPFIPRPGFISQKIAGIMVPLFSIRTKQNAGVGEILDLIPFIDWVKNHGIRLIQILPIYETEPEETSPYQALSSFAIDPVYLSIVETEGFKVDAQVADYLEKPSVHTRLLKWREKDTVDVKPIRAFKYAVLQAAFKQFKEEIWRNQNNRSAISFQRFMDRHSAWLQDYALFWQLKQHHHWSHWHAWPEAYQHRNKEALSDFAQKHSDQILFIQYVQWVLWSQWSQVRAHALKTGVKLMGDLPFLVSRDSADVWCNPSLFDQDISIGAPPDDFNADGQDWGLPVFLWEAMEQDHFNWWRRRIKEASQYFDLLRLDHVVGFFRVWVMPKGEQPYFEPGDEGAQIARGACLLKVILSELGDCIPVAEDLGCVPDFVRKTLIRFHIAGHKVLRWEKEGDDYRHPVDYPFLSMATTGTHDNATLSEWWNRLSSEERICFLDLLNHPVGLSAGAPYNPSLQEAIIDLMLSSGAGIVIFPLQDILCDDQRVNVPGTVGSENWCYRMPLALSEIDSDRLYGERLSYFKSAVKRFSRDKRNDV